MSLEHPVTLEERAYAAYRIAACKARKKGHPVPDRAEYTARYMAKNGQQPAQPATSATIPPLDVSTEPPATQSARLGLNSHKETDTAHGKQETGPESVLMPEKAHCAPQVHSGATPARDPVTGRYPARVPLCPPATVEQYKSARDLMLDGRTFSDIRAETGITTWAALQERGMRDDPDAWRRSVTEWQAAREMRLADLAQRTAEQGRPAIRRMQTGPNGEATTSQEYRTDPAMIDRAAALVNHEIHGRAAGRQPPVQITTTNAAFFGGPPPPGSLAGRFDD